VRLVLRRSGRSPESRRAAHTDCDPNITPLKLTL